MKKSGFHGLSGCRSSSEASDRESGFLSVIFILFFSEMVHFSASEVPVLEGIKDDLQALGFDLSDLGGGSYAINGVPAGIEGLNPERLVIKAQSLFWIKPCRRFINDQHFGVIQ